MSTLSPNISAIPSLRVSCSHCNLREHCVPLGLSLHDIDRLEDLIASRKRIHRGEPLFRAGDRFEAIYAIRLGSYFFSAFGGLVVNRDFQVLDKSNKPIKGLYATGLEVSKVVGHTYTTWTSGYAFGFAAYSGRHAGLNAAEAIK